MKPIHFLGILFIVVGYFTFKVFYPFLSTLTIATLLALATYKIHRYFLRKFPGNIIPALASTLLLALIFFAPLVYIITNAAAFVAKIDIDTINQTIKTVNAWTSDFIKHHEILQNSSLSSYTAQIDVNKIIKGLFNLATFLGAKSANFFKDIVLILIFYFFANLYGKDILTYFRSIVPFSKEDSEKIFENLASVMGIVFNSIIATAILEGALFGIIAYIFGYNGIMLGILYGFASLIPVVGGVIMWLPLSIDLYLHGNHTGAFILALYSIVVISFFADTIIKPIIIRYIDKVMVETESVRVNELLIFFSIVAGLSSYGFWGMIIGPAVVTLMISILNIYPKLSRLR